MPDVKIQGLRPEDLTGEYTQDDARKIEDLDPIDQAEWAANSLARCMEDLPEVQKVVERQRALHNVKLLLRVAPQDKKQWIAGPATQLVFAFSERSDVEFFCGEQLLPFKSPLGQPKLKYGVVIMVATKNWISFIRDVSNALSDYGPKLLVSASPLMGPPTPTGSLVEMGGEGKRGAIIIGQERYNR